MKKLAGLNNGIFFTIFLFSVFFHFPAYARFATPADTDMALDLFNREVEIRKDGTYTETIEVIMEAVKEGGKDRLVSYPLIYNKSNSEMKILEAKTIFEGKEYPVDPKKIEDKPLASSPQGFDQNHQVLIAFPQMAVNAKAYIKYRLIVKEAAVPNFFSTDFIYGAGQYFKASTVKVTSELPLYVKIQDPEHYLSVKQSSGKTGFKMEISLKRPIIKLVVEEQFASSSNEIYPWVSVSTLKEWSDLGQLIYKPYEAVVTQKLPERFEKIAAVAQTKSNTIEKINVVTSQLAENLTYMGDWISVKGRYIPRNLAEISATKYGDCKDFSASTVAILRHMGIKADLALIYRQTSFYEFPHNLPKMQDFNHIIVRVQDGGKTLWIDPTNSTSFAQGIYPDIAERNALVLDPKNPNLERTSTLSAKDSETIFSKKLVLFKDKPNVAYVEGQISLLGTATLPLTGAALNASKESISHAIISHLTDEGRTESWKVEDFDLTSRIVKDLNFKYHYTVRHDQLKTTAGDAYMLPMPGMLHKFLIKTNDRISDLLLDLPSTNQRNLVIAKTALLGTQNLNCTLESPWLSSSRNIQDSEEGIQVSDNFEVKKDKVSNSDLKSGKFSEFQNDLYNCFGDMALVYKNQ